ncbi:MAG: hypothetical protein WC848_06800 [Parcubacteria group bacterium]|jgi:hypothetical protein
MNLSLIFSQLGLSAKTSQDVMLFLVVALISFVFGMSIGRFKLITVLINIYVAVALLSVFPEKILPDYTYELILFFGIIVVLTILGKKMFEIPLSGSGKGFLWRVFAMSFLEVMLMLSVMLSIVPKKIALSYVSSSSYDYLISPNFAFFWMLAPLLFMFLIHKKLLR